MNDMQLPNRSIAWFYLFVQLPFRFEYQKNIFAGTNPRSNMRIP